MPGAGKREGWEAAANGFEAFLENDENVLEFDSDDDFRIYSMAKATRRIRLLRQETTLFFKG